MGTAEILLIALGLSMDAFAVSITLGLAAGKRAGRNGPVRAFIPGLYFGAFQALMPLIGYFAGVRFTGGVQSADHWIAFALLGFIGAKMIRDSFGDRAATGASAAPAAGEKDPDAGNPLRFTKMLILAVATSLDALAVGVTFAFLKTNILRAASLIGLTTFCLSVCGGLIGAAFGARLKSKAEFAGGAVLVLIGVKILVEHLLTE